MERKERVGLNNAGWVLEMRCDGRIIIDMSSKYCWLFFFCFLFYFCYFLKITKVKHTISKTISVT